MELPVGQEVAAPPMQPGIHRVHKPVGVSSFSVVRDCHAEQERRGGRRLKISHGGTLDPFAEGLLLVLAGQATRLMPLLHPIPKTYVATVAWGLETDTGDAGGAAAMQGPSGGLTPEGLEESLARFLGWQEQVPPATSAKKVGGEPAYKKVFRGERVELPPCRVYLHRARWLDHDLPRASRLELVCRGGYYVRALARDLGRAIGCGAHLTALSRTSIGPWSDPAPGQREWVHGAALLPWCASRRLTDAELGALRQERPIPRGELERASWRLPDGFPDPQAPIRAFHREHLVGLLSPAAEGLAASALFPGGL